LSDRSHAGERNRGVEIGDFIEGFDARLHDVDSVGHGSEQHAGLDLGDGCIEAGFRGDLRGLIGNGGGQDGARVVFQRPSPKSKRRNSGPRSEIVASHKRVLARKRSSKLVITGSSPWTRCLMTSAVIQRLQC
jgi:hypothetical protein